MDLFVVIDLKYQTHSSMIQQNFHWNLKKISHQVLGGELNQVNVMGLILMG